MAEERWMRFVSVSSKMTLIIWDKQEYTVQHELLLEFSFGSNMIYNIKKLKFTK